MIRVAVGDPQKVTVTFPTTAAGQVLVTVTREDGTVIAAGAVASDETGGVYGYQLAAADVATVDELRLVFSGTFAAIARARTEFAHVAGDHYFAIAELRAQPDLADTAKYPDEDLAAARVAVEDLIDRNCDTSFAARYHRDIVSGDGGCLLRLEQSYVVDVLGVKIDGTALTTPQVDSLTPDGRGWLEATTAMGGYWPYGRRNIAVRYAGGFSEQPPKDLRDAGLVAARGRLLAGQRTGVPSQATSLSTDVGTLQLAIAGLRHPTGIPEVDAVILGWANQVAAVI